MAGSGEREILSLSEKYFSTYTQLRIILSQMAKHDPALDQLFHALSDPTRRAMVERLLAGPASVSDLARPTGMSLPTVMKHLGVLERSGLVATEKSGRTRICRVTPAPLTAAQAWLEDQRRSWEARLDRLEDYLATLPKEPEP